MPYRNNKRNMANKKKKEEKEPNLGLSLAAAILFLAMVLICFVDYVKQLTVSVNTYGVVMTAFMAGCIIALLWLIGYIFKRMKAKKKQGK